MKRVLLAVLAGLAVAGCQDRIEPQMCVLRVDTGGAKVDLDTIDVARCPEDFHVRDGEAFFLIHQLPAGLELPDSLEIRLETPCQTVSLSRARSGERLVLPLVAPPGADCVLAVTATLANSELHQISTRSPAACGACPLAADAGAGGAAP